MNGQEPPKAATRSANRSPKVWRSAKVSLMSSEIGRRSAALATTLAS